MKTLLALASALALCSCQTTGSSCCSTPGAACCKDGSACKDGKCPTCKGCGKPAGQCICKKN